MVLRRKEKKEYGTGRMVEGIYERGQRCLIVEDVVTSGASVLETAESLKNEGLLITDAVVLVDRQQGGRKHLAEKGIRLHAVCTITSLVEILLQKKKIDEQTADSTLRFIASSS
jgi:uridine monophosphate synthetase